MFKCSSVEINELVSILVDNAIKHSEKNSFVDIIKENPLPMSKYYFNVLETTGFLNLELSFKSLCDFQNYFVKNYFNTEVIKRYVASEISDWPLFCEYHYALREFSFNSNKNIFP